MKNPFSFFSRKSLTRPIKLTDGDGTNPFFTFMTGGVSTTTTTTQSGQAWSYNNCPAVNAIINKKVRAFTNGRWKIVNANGDVVTAGYKPLSLLLQQPNPTQTWVEFVAQAKVYEQAFGEVYILPVTPVGFKKDATKALWVVPNWIVTENITGKVFGQSELSGIIKSYTLAFGGYSTEVPAENMLRIRDISVFVSDRPEQILHAQSRLYPLSYPVNNIIAAYQARNVLITRKGAIGILSNDGKDVGGTIPLKPKEKSELQSDFQAYGLSSEQWQVIVTNASLKWQAMSFPTKDLMLFEEIMDDTRQIADAYDYPMYLLGFKEGSTFSNVAEAKKTLYQDAIIPESNSFAEAFTRFFELPDGIRLAVSFDHLEIFQRSRKDIADAIRLLNQGMLSAYQNKIITREEWRSAMELDPEKFLGNTFFEGVPGVNSPQDTAHSEQPKLRD